jgi:hypothetical protein
MIKKLVAATILMTLLYAMADARVPKVRDNVTIIDGEFAHVGYITDITDQYICLNTSHLNSTSYIIGSGDMCFGWGTVVLGWRDDL